MDRNSVLLCEFARFLVESSDSDSSDEENELLLMIANNKPHVMPHLRCQYYVENVVPLYTDKEFKMHFRMRRNTFQFLLELLRPKLCKQTERFGREPILPEKQLLIAIWMLATPNSYRFNVGKGTAWRCVHRVINALYAEVRTFIKWPTRQEAEQTMETIQNQYGFPGVIGAVDGTHVRIAAPQDHVGFVHDMRVFRLSNVESMFTEENFPHDSHILGDAAYRISKYVMVPFKDNSHLTERQINFNKCQSGARMIVERSLGLLKGRFRSILDTLPMRKTRVIPKYIMACCILHNICLLRNDMIDIPIIVDEPNIAQPVQLENNVEQRQGIDKRNAIMYNLLPNISSHIQDYWTSKTSNFDWNEYLEALYASATPENLFSEYTSANETDFECGMRLEAVNPKHKHLQYKDEFYNGKCIVTQYIFAVVKLIFVLQLAENKYKADLFKAQRINAKYKDSE
ncbi:hypothetical protein DBV15_12365 [Temnothorax longispinosus]|uniref:DDE Tnp4 domain-containing protein n=1 Tax=Temnothorax longispinosus TaxID=300112 RepID=A0A4S2KKT1_9HYME|nr:hypothetical protein DBV15_12365 [Temnothorax longispinosus]